MTSASYPSWFADYYGVVMKLTLNEDGTAAMSLSEQMSGTATWTLEGDKFTMTESETGTVTEGTFTGTELVLKQGETEIPFGREPLEGIKLAEVKADAAAEEFEGVWKVQYMSMAGMLIDAETAAASYGEQMPVLTVKDGKISFSNEDGSENGMMSMYGSAPMEMTYADGELSCELALGELKISFKCIMLQDGMLGFTIIMGDEVSMGFYFCRTGEAEAPAA